MDARYNVVTHRYITPLTSRSFCLTSCLNHSLPSVLWLICLIIATITPLTTTQLIANSVVVNTIRAAFLLTPIASGGYGWGLMALAGASRNEATSLPKFRIIAVIPNEKAAPLSRELRQAVSRWQQMIREQPPDASIPGHQRNPFVMDETSMILSPIPVGNDTQRLLESMCDAFEIHNPSLILSLLESRRTYYLKMIADKVDVPILTLSSDYRETFHTHRPKGVSTDNSEDLSLDPPISSLADATFQLLRMQHWFDAILLIDDTAASDLFSYRLTRLCRKNHRKEASPESNYIRSNSSESGQDAAGQKMGEQSSESYRQSFSSRDYHLMDSIWNKLEVIQLSRNLLQNEFYMQMSEIQTSHRRVILVHCDKLTTKRIFEVAQVLGLLGGQKIWVLLDGVIGSELVSSEFKSQFNLPPGVIGLHQRAPNLADSDKLFAIIKFIGEAAINTLINARSWISESDFRNGSVPEISCWHNATGARIKYSQVAYREIQKVLKTVNTPYDGYKCQAKASNTATNATPQNDGKTDLFRAEKEWPYPVFDILNLVSVESHSMPPEMKQHVKMWKVVGNITRHNATLNAITYMKGPTADTSGGPYAAAKHHFRVVTGIAPPFVHLSTKLDNGTCLTGVACLRVNTSKPDDLVHIFTDFNSQIRSLENKMYTVMCCSGIAIDLLNSIARDLNFNYDLYLVADGLFGIPRNGGHWDGITADLVSGAAHITFSAFSVTSARVNVIDYSVPFFYSGVSCLARSQFSDVPLSAFLIPFSYQLWCAIFLSLHVTAVAAAIYEWLSPFGLNPWGRQRTKNFSLASALWVMYSLLFSHLVAFKAPKSWPNKVLINLWGCFSVIFLATYTANIAAHFAGLFLNEEIDDFHDGALQSMRTGVARSSASEGYIKKENMALYEHVQKFMFKDFDEGLARLRNQSLEVLIGDTAILNYFKANEPGCNLKLLGDSIFDDAYAVAMQKGFPLKNAISDLILKYNTYGYLDQLQRKWYGRVPCLENSLHNFNTPKPLSVRAVAGVFIMLLLGLAVGILILMIEHLVFRYVLPKLRTKPKDTCWKSPNLMFFSQKLYRFINTVELVSPHHSAKEIMSSLRTGQITSLFQKSLKRKAKEEARRRKSKSQFFEMIQEVRKVVQEQKDEARESIEEPLEMVVSTVPPHSGNRDSLWSENDSIGGATTIRTSSIRWKEPSFSVEEESSLLHQPILKTPPTIPLPSLKSARGDSRLKITKSQVSSRTSELYPTPLGGLHSCFPRSASSMSSVASEGKQWGATQIINMRENYSISLEDVALPGDSGCCLGAVRRRGEFPKGAKTWSFDDLSVLKQQLTLPAYSPSEQERMGLVYAQSPLASVIIPSPRHSNIMDEIKIQNMTKEDIISLWRSSERELLNNLQDALQQKKALEERLAVLQRILMKPP